MRLSERKETRVMGERCAELARGLAWLRCVLPVGHSGPHSLTHQPQKPDTAALRKELN